MGPVLLRPEVHASRKWDGQAVFDGRPAAGGIPRHHSPAARGPASGGLRLCRPLEAIMPYVQLRNSSPTRPNFGGVNDSLQRFVMIADLIVRSQN